jgi:hypothetical protein
MSACFVLVQSKSVHMVTDASSYLNDGTVVAVNLTKATVSATMRMAVSCPGPGGFQTDFADRMERDFDTFDDLIEHGGGAWVVAQFNEMAALRRRGDAFSTLYLIGWHEREQRPAAYVVTLFTDTSSEWERVRSRMTAEDIAEAMEARNKLHVVDKGVLNGTPMPSEAWMERGRFEVQFADDYVPAVDLLHLVEIARQSITDDEGAVVGGKAVLTSIDATGISQKIIRHWAEDKIGERIHPGPVEWAGFRAARLMSAAAVPAVGISRLQRERMEKKARKGTLRV